MRKHPYIVATVIATLLAVVVWLCVPKKYTAVTKISDEYKEVDLAIGLDVYSARIKNAFVSANLGMNNIETYCQAIKTDDFARFISHVQVPDKGMTYGQYLGKKDTIEAVKGNINYIISNRQQTLLIGFSDKDALIASQMLDSVTAHLQDIVTNYRRYIDKHILHSVEQELAEAKTMFDEAEKAYSLFADSHQRLKNVYEKQKESVLETELKLARKNYLSQMNQYIRHQSLSSKPYTSFAVVQANVVPQETNTYLFPYILSFVLMALTLTKAGKLYLDKRSKGVSIEWGGAFSPWMITLSVWGGMMGLFFISGDILYPLTNQFYYSVALWITILVVTSFVTFNLLEHRTQPLPLDGIKVNKAFFYFLFFVAVVLSPMYMYRVWQTISSFDSDDMLKNARILAVYGEGQGILNYAIVIAQSLLLVALWRYPKIPWWQLAIIIACCILNSIAIMEKGSTFLVLLCSMYVLFERKVIKMRTILFSGVLVVTLFYFVNLMREGENSDFSQDATLLDFIGMYIMSPPVAYSRIVQEIGSQFGTNTFETIYLFLDRFGIGNFEVHEKTQEFLFVPISTNVYTIMQPFFRDFGYWGVAFFAWGYGVLSGVLYRYSCNGNVFCICMYTYLVEILVLQFYQENLFLSMVFVLQLVFFVLLLTQDKIKLSYGR